MKYTPPNVQSYNFADVNKAVQLGQAAMAIQWASGAKPMEDKTRSTVAGKLGYTLVPKAVRQTPMRGVWTIGIAKNSSQSGRRLAVRDVAVQQGVRPRRGEISERDLGDP